MPSRLLQFVSLVLSFHRDDTLDRRLNHARFIRTQTLQRRQRRTFLDRQRPLFSHLDKVLIRRVGRPPRPLHPALTSSTASHSQVSPRVVRVEQYGGRRLNHWQRGDGDRFNPVLTSHSVSVSWHSAPPLPFHPSLCRFRKNPADFLRFAPQQVRAILCRRQTKFLPERE